LVWGHVSLEWKKTFNYTMCKVLFFCFLFGVLRASSTLMTNSFSRFEKYSAMFYIEYFSMHLASILNLCLLCQWDAFWWGTTDWVLFFVFIPTHHNISFD
jgi:hypothetical protein